MSNVRTKEVQAKIGKGIQQPNQVPRKVTFKYSSFPSEHVEIVSNEVVTRAGKSIIQSCIRNMVEGVSILDEGIVDLEGTPSRQKRKRSAIIESNVIPEYEVKILGAVGKSLL